MHSIMEQDKNDSAEYSDLYIPLHTHTAHNGNANNWRDKKIYNLKNELLGITIRGKAGKVQIRDDWGESEELWTKLRKCFGLKLGTKREKELDNIESRK